MRYALEFRPASIGAVPRGYSAVEPSDITEARHGVIVYDEPLSEADMRGYELRPILGPEEVAFIAVKLANRFERYREKLLALYDDRGLGMVRQMVASAFEKAYPTRPIVGDFDAFVGDVMQALRSK